MLWCRGPQLSWCCENALESSSGEGAFKVFVFRFRNFQWHCCLAAQQCAAGGLAATDGTEDPDAPDSLGADAGIDFDAL